MTTLVMHTRRWLDAGGPLAGLAALLAAAAGLSGITALAGQPNAIPAMQAVLLATLATGAGALPVLFARRISARAQDGMLGFAAGIMLAASVFSLILPALGAGAELTGSKLGGGLVVAAGVALGAALLLVMDRLLPHEHFVKGREGGWHGGLARVWLFVFAIALHNLPEGLAMGVAFAGGEAQRALPLAFGIAVQNLPEGLAVALALLTAGYAPGRAALIAFATGMVEPVGALLGFGAIAASALLLPWGLAFAGGAMLFVVSHEIIPETHRNGHETPATVGLVAGFVMMMLFDTM